jgi:pimeloyl-ACP methyl ester carboxylesterase
LLFQNGTPSTGRLYAPFVEAATQRGLTMISFSRAGYGSSTRNPGRNVADVVPDARAVIDQLGASSFYVVGWSGGGPHALACAALLSERVIGAATVGGLAPHDAEGIDWLAGMGQENVAAFSAALESAGALRAIAERVASSFATVTSDDVAKNLGNLVSEVDRLAMSGQASAWLARDFRESVRRGMWGWYDDELALVKPGASIQARSACPWRFGRGRRTG